MNPEKATHCKEIRKILKEALHDNKDSNLYLGSGNKHAKLTDGAYSLTIPSSPSDRKSVKNFEKELTEFIKKLRENRITHEAHE
ncbi:hypothetical protein [Helicobacter pylori]|uniref:hypothetical protein n=1 Tax=Helicobacter pylori TaxID=210 RepID=UPI0002BC5B9F|nr:hypothetical protein [Helicobacter pylori]EMH08110.1 hypothetical protein HMPREF1411_01466 [Helicobacter pylori GAM250AFi]EMH13682.1 hypothetical protein HMPREF1412_00927 [Helicobacter pylori GAM250T]EMH13728.1 hypothetical protein HMPREF1414_01077 [Helicobacter pylori GAM252T]EMH15079.1 hypothetical protein HMPREF1413_00615 [Helicobacter pylori GAM252Bi]EMH48589.1 hypothetical protein HMPREF1438_00599 [Helicobacter pylori HP250AFii]